MHNVAIIFKKEFRDLIRDRRTIFFMIVFPLLMIPMFMVLGPKLIEFTRSKQAERVIKVAVLNPDVAPNLKKALAKGEGFEMHYDFPADSIQQYVLEGKLDVVVSIASDFEQCLLTKEPVPIKLEYKNADDMEITINRIKSILYSVENSLLTERYLRMDLNADNFNVFNIETINYASQREKLGKTIGGFLPYIFVIFCFMGVVSPALDLVAGEKERRTLETILTSPANRLEIMLGKFGVTALFGIVTASIGIIGLLLGMKILGSNSEAKVLVETLQSIVNPGTILLILSLLVPLSVLLAGASLSISMFARSFREAQSIIAPLNILVIAPVLVGLVPGISLNWWTALIPIVNVSLASKEILAGSLDPLLLGLVYISQFLLAYLAIVVTVALFRREDIIFRA